MRTDRRPALVCFGDSITLGTIGAAYPARLEPLLPQARVVNAGVNGDTVVNLLRRVQRDLIALRPAAVFVQIGLNDFASAYGEHPHRAYYHAFKHVHTRLTIPRFVARYRQLIGQIRAQTGASIALGTLTLFGEELESPVQIYLDAYSHAVRALAAQEGCGLVDLRAAFTAAVGAAPYAGPEYHIWTPVQDWARIGLRGADYETLRARRGYLLLVDGVHLSAAGADLAAQTIAPVVRELLAAR